MNNNIFNPQQNGYYSYPYSTNIMPQQMVPQFIKGRPVSSFEEARVAQIDLDGSVFFFPDLGNKKIYTKKINVDGTATVQSFVLETPKAEPAPEYVTRTEIEELKTTLNDLVAKLKAPDQKPTNYNF